MKRYLFLLALLSSPVSAGNQLYRCFPPTFPVYECPHELVKLRWDKPVVTYSVDPDMPYRDDVIEEIEAINDLELNIKVTQATSNGDIEMEYIPYRLDGGTVPTYNDNGSMSYAYCFVGAFHTLLVDEDQKFNALTNKALHEFLHALGVDHSQGAHSDWKQVGREPRPDQFPLMYPITKRYAKGMIPDDYEALRKIYGDQKVTTMLFTKDQACNVILINEQKSYSTALKDGKAKFVGISPGEYGVHIEPIQKRRGLHITGTENPKDSSRTKRTKLRKTIYVD